MKVGLFLDRDGVINVDYPYVHTQDKFEFIDGIFELCLHAQELGYQIFVVTNQAGIGRGYYTEQVFEDLSSWMCAQFAARGITIAKIYFCPFHPQHGIGEYRAESNRRKPAPGMLLDAANEFAIDLSRSVLIGNNESDIQAGKAAKLARCILYCPTEAQAKAESGPEQRSVADVVVAELIQAKEYL